MNGDMTGSSLPDIGSFEQYVTTAAPVIVSGRVMSKRQGVSGAVVTLASMDGETMSTTTDKRGYFRFDDVPGGETYLLTVSAKKMRFESQLINIDTDAMDILITGDAKRPGRVAGLPAPSPTSDAAGSRYAARASAG